MSADHERRVRVYHVPESDVWELFQGRGQRLPEFLQMPVMDGVPPDCCIEQVHYDPYRRAFAFFLSHPSFDPVPEGDTAPGFGGLDSRIHSVRITPEAQYAAQLEGVIADLREDMLSESAAYRRGVEDGVRQEGERVLGRILKAVENWRQGDKETDRYAAYALEAIGSCITYRGVTREAALERVREGLGGCSCGQGNAAEPPSALPHRPGCPRAEG